MKSCGEKKPQYTIPLPARLVDFLKGTSAKRILDVGCGYGRTCFYLIEDGYSIVGVDVDKGQIESATKQAKEQHISQKVDFLANDAPHLCFSDSSFDAVTMLGILTLVPESERSKIVN